MAGFGPGCASKILVLLLETYTKGWACKQVAAEKEPTRPSDIKTLIF